MAHVYYLVFNNSYDETIKPFKFVNREEQVLSFYPYKCLTLGLKKLDKFKQLFSDKEELNRFFLQFNYAIIKKLIEIEDSLHRRYIKKKMGFKDLFMRMVDETPERFLCHLAWLFWDRLDCITVFYSRSKYDKKFYLPGMEFTFENEWTLEDALDDIMAHLYLHFQHEALEHEMDCAVELDDEMLQAWFDENSEVQTLSKFEKDPNFSPY